MRITLHIGTHKTGTTFLQNNLSMQADALSRQGVYYLGKGPNHSWLYLLFCENPESEHALMRMGITGQPAVRSWIVDRREFLTHEIESCPATAHQRRGNLQTESGGYCSVDRISSRLL